MSTLFAMNLRISLSSTVMYFIANMADIFIYDTLRIKTHGKKIWLRNNIATITYNCIENFLFILFGFYGLYNFVQCIQIAFSVSIIEAIVGICDTPFLYLAVRVKKTKEGKYQYEKKRK